MTSTQTDNDAALSLAFAVHSNPGAYALLLGAGVSAPSVHTAWRVLEDLCRQVALLEEATPGDDATQWYEEHFATEPKYGTVLEKLARTPAERQRLLAGYFEPTVEDVEARRKVPTAAHEAIAQLVLAGSVRVIITLNFDRLMEQALRAAGVEPTVASTPADIEGLAPLHTLRCVVIHLNGDYLNPTAMRNTEAELDGYDVTTQALLERVLTDYGLIVAGWSAQYDTRLRDTISSVYPGRYTLTWVEPSELTDIALELGTRTNAVYMKADADTAFGILRDAVESLKTRNAAHHLTVPVAVQTAKRELSGRTVAIGLHDRLNSALETLQALPDFHLPNYDTQLDYPAMVARIEEASKLTTALVATLAYWGSEDTDEWWVDELHRFAIRPPASGIMRLLDARRLAGTPLFYAAAVSAVARKRWSLLDRLLTTSAPNPSRYERVPLYTLLTPGSTYDPGPTFVAFPQRLIGQVADVLTLSRSTVEDAWQTFEIIKLAKTLTSHNLFDERFEAIATVLSSQLTPAVTQTPSNTTQSHELRDALKALVELVPYTRPHVYVEDRGLDNWASPIAARLAKDLDADTDQHPLVQAGVLPSVPPKAGAFALLAVNQSLNRQSEQLSWSAPGPDGSMAMRLWLDSGEQPS